MIESGSGLEERVCIIGVGALEIVVRECVTVWKRNRGELSENEVCVRNVLHAGI